MVALKTNKVNLVFLVPEKFPPVIWTTRFYYLFFFFKAGISNTHNTPILIINFRSNIYFTHIYAYTKQTTYWESETWFQISVCDVLS